MVADTMFFSQPTEHQWHQEALDSDPGPLILPSLRHRSAGGVFRQEGPWFLGPQGHPEAVLVKLKEPLQPDAPAPAQQVETEQHDHIPTAELEQRGREAAWQDFLNGRSVRHTVSYANLNGQEELHEAKVTCSGNDCETSSQDVVPRIHAKPDWNIDAPKARQHRWCAGSGSPRGGSLIWDGLDRLVTRAACSAKQFFGYAPTNSRRLHDAGLCSHGVGGVGGDGYFKTYSYTNINGRQELQQVDSHCHDGTCVKRTRTYSPSEVQRPIILREPQPQEAPAPSPPPAPQEKFEAVSA